jgi:hypothetical protein
MVPDPTFVFFGHPHCYILVLYLITVYTLLTSLFCIVHIRLWLSWLCDILHVTIQYDLLEFELRFNFNDQGIVTREGQNLLRNQGMTIRDIVKRMVTCGEITRYLAKG